MPKNSIISSLDRWSLVDPERPFLTHISEADEGTTVTYGDVDAASKLFAGLISGYFSDQLKKDIGGSNTIAIAADNTPDSVFAILALLRLGVSCLFLNPADPPARWGSILDQHDVAGVLGSSALDGVRVRVASFAELRTRSAVPHAADHDCLPDEVAFLFPTSGSTAASKLVMQPHRAVESNAEAICRHHALDSQTVVMGGLPIHHVNGLHFTIMGILKAGAHVILPQRISPFTYHRHLSHYQPDIASAVPSVLESLLSMARGWQPPGSLRYFVSAAAPLTNETINRLHAELGIRVLQGYGLTETTNFSTTMPRNVPADTFRRVALEAPIPSVGIAIEGNQVEILDRSGVPLPEGVVGEICMQGENVMLGYARRQDLTDEVLVDGWFRSGDLGYWMSDPSDERRYFYITGRVKNIAKVRGEAVSLEEVERALKSLAIVHDAACVRLPDSLSGERIAAICQLSDSATAGAATLRRHLKPLLPAVAIPSSWLFVDRVPRTSTGKLLRAELRALVVDA